MKVGFVVQRYGIDVIGGAEYLCRQVAEHMAKHWEVEVITTCARLHTTWRNEYPPGEQTANGVVVRRFLADRERDQATFSRLSQRVLLGLPHRREEEVEWMQAQGPYSTPLLHYLRKHKASYDAFLFYTYLYCTSYFGLPLVADKAMLVPATHDEPMLRLSIFDELFHLPRALIFLTPEEQQLVYRRFGNREIPHTITGIGMGAPPDSDPDRFRHRYGISGPFAAYLGRVEEGKGCLEMLDFFLWYRAQRHEEAKLVLMGPSIMPIPDRPDIIHLGPVDEQTKQDALAAAEVLIQPSPYESLSIVILEAWLAGTPVLVNGRCAVLKGQCRRSQGGLWYENRYEFEEALSLLLADPTLRQRLAANGRRYVEANYSWERIERKYQEIAGKALPEATRAQ